MKKNISLLVIGLMLMIAAPAHAQFFQWGFKGGANISKISFNKDNMGGFFFGPIVEFNVPVLGVGIDGAFLYDQRGVKSHANNFKQSGFDIPVNLKYTLALTDMLGVYVGLGPNFYFNLKGNDGWVHKRKAMIGMNFGAGINLLRHLQIGFNYNIPFDRSGHIDVSAMERYANSSYPYKDIRKNYKIRTWQISLAYLF